MSFTQSVCILYICVKSTGKHTAKIHNLEKKIAKENTTMWKNNKRIRQKYREIERP